METELIQSELVVHSDPNMDLVTAAAVIPVIDRELDSLHSGGFATSPIAAKLRKERNRHVMVLAAGGRPDDVRRDDAKNEELDLPHWFLGRSPLSMDPVKGPDDQYCAGARDMLVVVETEFALIPRSGRTH